MCTDRTPAPPPLQVLKGELLLNGKPYQIRELKKMSGYVMQVSAVTWQCQEGIRSRLERSVAVPGRAER